MQINKTDFKVILNHMKSLSQLENNNLINQTRNGKTDYNDINQLINIYSSKKISKLMDKINNNFLTFSGGEKNDYDDNQEEDNYNREEEEDNQEEDEDEITKTKKELINIITSLEKYIEQLQKQQQPKKQQLMKIFNKLKKKK